MDTQGNTEGGKEPGRRGFTRVPPDERRCSHVYEDGDKAGERCVSWAMKDSAAQLCAGHAGVGVAASPEAARAAQALSAERSRERAEKPVRSAKQVFREGVERDAEEFYAIKLAIARDERAPASDRLRAMEALETRAMGRPTERVEVESKTPTTVTELQAMSMEERIAFIRARTKAVNED